MSALTDTQQLVEFDWLETRTGSRIHHKALSVRQADEMEAHGSLDESLILTCGRYVSEVWIPGVFTRMGAMRCSRCATRLGYPHGKGSPKNDPACADVLRARIDGDAA